MSLEDLSDASWGVLGLYGPRAGTSSKLPTSPSTRAPRCLLNGADLLAAGVAVPVGGYDLLGPSDALETARNHLRERGAVAAGLDAYEAARIEAGVPRFGSDITPENFPAEAGILERAVSFEKGCYPGTGDRRPDALPRPPEQELHRFVVEGTPPAPGAEIAQSGRQVGWITSVAPLPVEGQILALGYLHRNADPRGELES